MSARLSVLLPYRNAAETLDACLDSLEKQSFRDFELVAVDDGSNDDSRQRFDHHASLPTMHLDNQGSGLVSALNLGLEACRSPLVARIDADDLAHPDRFALQVAALDAEPELGVISCLVESFSSEALGEGQRLYDLWLNSAIDDQAIKRERFIESPIAHPSVMLRRQLLASGYVDDELPEDYELWLRLAEAGVRFAKVPRVLYSWRDHQRRLSRVDSRYSRAAFSRLRARYLQRGPLAGRSVLVWGAGQYGKRLARDLLREGTEIEAFVDIDPLKIGRRMRDRPVIAADEIESLIGPRTTILAAVPARGARELIRHRLVQLGLAETRDFWCVA